MTNIAAWTEELAYEIALLMEGSGESRTEIHTRYGYSQSEFKRLCRNTNFQNTVNKYRESIRSDDTVLKAKARIAADKMLTTIVHEFTHPATEYKDKISAFKLVTELAGHKAVAAGNGVNIQINLSSSPNVAHRVDTNGKSEVIQEYLYHEGENIDADRSPS